MGRLWHGNAMAHKAACDRLQKMDLNVTSENWFDMSNMRHGMAHTVTLHNGFVLVGKTFSHFDEDCLYNEATAWLHSVADDLKNWK